MVSENLGYDPLYFKLISLWKRINFEKYLENGLVIKRVPYNMRILRK